MFKLLHRVNPFAGTPTHTYILTHFHPYLNNHPTKIAQTWNTNPSYSYLKAYQVTTFKLYPLCSKMLIEKFDKNVSLWAILEWELFRMFYHIVCLCSSSIGQEKIVYAFSAHYCLFRWRSTDSQVVSQTTIQNLEFHLSVAPSHERGLNPCLDDCIEPKFATMLPNIASI